MVDQMAKTASNTNTSVGQLGEGILTIGATAKSVKGGTAELNTALGILANNGIKGAEGGTHLRNVILSLQNPTDGAEKTMRKAKIGYEHTDLIQKQRSEPLLLEKWQCNTMIHTSRQNMHIVKSRR